jgi:hypothetical protein
VAGGFEVGEVLVRDGFAESGHRVEDDFEQGFQLGPGMLFHGGETIDFREADS